jgi:hypothetical protein
VRFGRGVEPHDVPIMRLGLSEAIINKCLFHKGSIAVEEFEVKSVIEVTRIIVDYLPVPPIVLNILNRFESHLGVLMLVLIGSIAR